MHFLDPPVVVSPPHFYQSDKSLLETVNGLHPMKSAHETFLDVEPVSNGISDEKRIVAYSNVMLCEAKKGLSYRIQGHC